MTDEELKELQRSIETLARMIPGQARALLLAELLDAQITKFGAFCDETEKAAAIKSLLVVHADGFTTAQKAATESLMAREFLSLGLKRAREKTMEER